MIETAASRERTPSTLSAPNAAVEENAASTLHVGVTGHRRLDRLEETREAVERAFDLIVEFHPGRPVCVVSQLAEGADRLVARVALERGFRLAAILPFPRDEFRNDFGSAASRAEFDELTSRAHVEELPMPADRTAGYASAGHCMVDRAQVLIAIWDGQEDPRPGGTAEVVAEARRRRLPLAWVRAARPAGERVTAVSTGRPGELLTEGIDPLADAFRRRDAAATRYQRRRWQYALFAVALSPLAALLLASQVLFLARGGPVATVLIGAELLLLGLALALGYLQMGRSHRRWIDERLRAELLRRDRYLRLMRVGPYLGANGADLVSRVQDRRMAIDNDTREPAELILPIEADTSWLSALHQAGTGAGEPLPNLALRHREYLEDRVRDQRKFFSRKAAEHEQRARRYENASKLVLTAGLVFAGIHLGMLTGSDPHGSPGALHNAIVLLALVAPTVGSAFIGIHSVLGSHRLGRSYKLHAQALERSERALSHIRHDAADASLRLREAVVETEDLLSSELKMWRLIVVAQAPRAGA